MSLINISVIEKPSGNSRQVAEDNGAQGKVGDGDNAHLMTATEFLQSVQVDLAKAGGAGH